MPERLRDLQPFKDDDEEGEGTSYRDALEVFFWYQAVNFLKTPEDFETYYKAAEKLGLLPRSSED